MKLSNAHLAVTSFAALAGVALAGYQTLAPSAPPAPIVVMAPAEPVAAGGEAVVVKSAADTKTDAVVRAVPLTFSAALNDGSDKKYSFADLFDGKAESVVTISAPDNEINVLVSFGSDTVVTGLEYAPPKDATAAAATTLDVMVLPEGRMEATGRPVTSFALPSGAGAQTLALAAKEDGKALWLRIAGPAGTEKIAVGDFKVLGAN